MGAARSIHAIKRSNVVFKEDGLVEAAAGTAHATFQVQGTSDQERFRVDMGDRVEFVIHFFDSAEVGNH